MALNEGTIITLDDGVHYVITGRIVYEDIDYYAAYKVYDEERSLSGSRRMCYDEEYGDDFDSESDESDTSMVSVEDEELEKLLWEVYDTRISLYGR